MEITVEKINAAHLRVTCEDFGIEQEIENYFSFFLDGYKFVPSYKAGMWDGKVRLYNIKNNLLHVGLLDYLQKFADNNEYEIILKGFDEHLKQFSLETITKFADALNVHSRGNKIEYRDYQLDAILQAINTGRQILVSPTSCLDPEEEIEVKIHKTYNDLQNGNSVKRNIKLNHLKEEIENNLSVSIISSSGEYNQITDVYSKYSEGFIFSFDDETILKAAVNHKVLKDNLWIECKDLIIGDNINNKIITGIEDVPYQEWIDFTVDAPHESYYHKGMTHHNSGKSLIIYTLLRWYINSGKKCMIVVPSTLLVEQMYADFADYSTHNGWKVEENCHRIYSGKLRHFDFNCTISTYQSLLEIQSKKMFEEIDVAIFDECHLMSGKSANKILDSMTYANTRIGTTGTLNGKQITELQLTGLFGNVYKVTTTKKLMDNKEVTPLEIKCLVLDHSKEIKQLCKKIEYQKEMKFLTTDYKRNKFIRNLAVSLEGVTLLLFNYIEHGRTLFDMIKEKNQDEREIHYISGSVNTNERVEIRNVLNSTKNYRKFYFKNVYVKIYDDELVELNDNSTVKGYELTMDSDINDKWLANKELFNEI